MSGHVNQCAACGIGMPEGDMICRKCGVEPSDFERYQRQALRTANDFHTGKEWLCNVGLGLAGEAGEVADLIKKIAFHGHPLDRDKLMDEMGDVLWYLALAAEVLGMSLDEIANRNIDKLWERYPAGFDSVRSRERSLT